MSRGFTLIELLAVTLIMAILTAVAVPQYKSSMERSRIAEAQQMLPAIFDSRERLVEEQQGDDYDKGDMTFSRLDINMKGRAAEPGDFESHDGTRIMGHYWVTDTFLYYLFDPEGGPGSEYNVSAKLRRGTFSGAKLYFDGDTIRCCKKTSRAEDTCDILNIPELRVGC